MSAAPPGPVVAAAAGRGTQVRAPIRVALASEHELIAEAVVAALSSRNFEVLRLSWPGENGSGPEPEIAELRPDVALLVYEVDSALRMAAATALIRSWRGPWLVLAGVGSDEVAGGLLAAGASAAWPKASGLGEVEKLLLALATGVSPLSDTRRAELIARWRAAEAGRHALQGRIESLTPRERQTLELLRSGRSVREAAVQLGVSESTVRSHVRAILSKLRVKSQLAAVAAVLSQDEEFPQERRSERH